MLKVRKFCIVCTSVILLAANALWAQESHSKSTYLSFPSGDSFMLRLFSIKGLFKEVSPKQRIALMYKPLTLRDALTRVNTMNINDDTKSPRYSRQQLSELIEMRFNAKSRSYEIKVTVETEEESAKLMKAIMNAYVEACKEQASRQVEDVKMSLEREIPYTIKQLKKMRKINSDEDEKTLRREMREKVLERKLFNLFKIEAALSYEHDARSATGWFPIGQVRFINR